MLLELLLLHLHHLKLSFEIVFSLIVHSVTQGKMHTSEDVLAMS